MRLFLPDTAYVANKAFGYKDTSNIIEYLKMHGVKVVNSNKVSIDNETPLKSYTSSKRTILITTNNQKKLDTCKPSADYEFHLSSSCPGMCEYCYLQTTQGEKPFIKVFVNIDEILGVIDEHINAKKPNITTFEASSITDPIAVEHIMGNLKKCIEYFAKSRYGRLRLVTKYDDVDSLLGINHNNHTTFRFSINADYVINTFEHNTSKLEERITAVKKIAKAGYPIGFIVAPIMIYDGWEEEYKRLFEKLGKELSDYSHRITFELIQHRFTKTAKELILKRYPNTKLDMDEDKRMLKWGPYGKFKYVYKKEDSSQIKEHISKLISENFSNTEIEYFT